MSRLGYEYVSQGVLVDGMVSACREEFMLNSSQFYRV